MRLNRIARIEGLLRIPGDKSISHRAAMIAAMASGSTKISNFSTGVDCASTLSCLRQLGVEVVRENDNKVSINGTRLKASENVLDCGNSGSTIRMLAGVLAGQEFDSELSGDHSLNSRPMRRVMDPLIQMGAQIDSNEGKPPLRIRGRKLSPITYQLPIASAQVKSAILFAGLAAHGRTQIRELFTTRDHTERLFNGFGVSVTTSDDLTITLNGPAQLTGGEIKIPGDISSAAFYIAAAMLLPGSRLTIEGLGLNPTRTQFLNVLNSWGADITTEIIETQRNEPIGVVTVNGGVDPNRTETDRRTLRKDDIPGLIDELPMLAVVGTQIPGGIEIRDAAELRHKESDRLQTTADNLRRMGAEVEEYDDGIAVNGPTRLTGTSIDSFGDHRIAMAFSVAALIADGDTEIHNAECASISFPEFYTLLNSVTH